MVYLSRTTDSYASSGGRKEATIVGREYFFPFLLYFSAKSASMFLCSHFILQARRTGATNTLGTDAIIRSQGFRGGRLSLSLHLDQVLV